jgi:hypothetical protein
MREILESIAAIAIIVLQIVNIMLERATSRKVDDHSAMVRAQISGSEKK